jgi:protein-S-isoprenylcysteine O-methyltransferase Ste14
MNRLRLLIGYLIGFTLFVLFIPYLLVLGSQNTDLCLNVPFIPDLEVRLAISFPLFLIGVLFAIWSNIFLLHVGKGGPVDAFNVSISPRSQKLVTTGPYKYCRNPMVFGTLCLYCSISICLNSLHDLVVILLFVPLFVLFLKRTEEKRLLKDFKSEYLEYKSKVPMIVPFTKFGKKR